MGRVVTVDAAMKAFGTVLMFLIAAVCGWLIQQIGGMAAKIAEIEQRAAILETKVDGMPETLKLLREDMRRMADAMEQQRKDGQTERNELRKLILERPK